MFFAHDRVWSAPLAFAFRVFAIHIIGHFRFEFALPVAGTIFIAQCLGCTALF